MSQQKTRVATDTNERLELLRQLVVEAGLDVLDRDGLSLRADSITYAKVFNYLEAEHGLRVTRGSVHERIWASHDDFRMDVLTTAASHRSPYEIGDGMHDAIIRILTEAERRGLDHPERVQLFCRVAGQAMLNTYLKSDRFRQFQAIKAAARFSGDDAATALLRAMVREQADGNQQLRVDQFGFLFGALGLRARRELGLEDEQAADLFLTMVQVLVTGAHLDHHAGFAMAGSKVETGLPAPGEEWPWTYFGFAYLACIGLLFEPDPDSPDIRVPDQTDLPPRPEPEAAPTEQGFDADRPRRSRAELRRLVLAAGVELFLRDGLGLKAESLTYASVFAYIKDKHHITIHRSTVHPKIWTSQDEFQAEVLAYAARFRTDTAATTLKASIAALPIPRNPDGSVNRRQLTLDGIRAATIAQMKLISASPDYGRWQAIKASLLTREPDTTSDVIQQAVSERYDEMIVSFADVYRSVFPHVGLTVNPALKIDENQAYYVLAVVGATFATGADYNISAGAELAGRTVPITRCDGSGDTDDWPIFALGIRALVELLFVQSDQSAT